MGGVQGVIFGGEAVDRFDHVLGVLRHLVNIVAGLVATTGIWAMIIAAFIPPAEIVVVPAYEAISLGVIGADVVVGLAEMSKAWYSATRDGISAKTREAYLSMFSGSAIATAIVIILVLLGALASRLAQKFKAARRVDAGEAGKPGKGAGEKPKEPAPQPSDQKTGPAADDNAKPAPVEQPKTTKSGLPLSNPVSTSEMAREAVKRCLAAPAAERATLYRVLKQEITDASKGSWTATESTGTQGETIFIGSQGRTLIFTSEGAMWVGDVNALRPGVHQGKLSFAPDYTQFKEIK